jgi:lysine-specific demethylase 8
MQSMMKLHEFIDVFLLKTAKPRRSITGGETPSLAWHRGHLTDQFTILQDDHNVPVFVQSTPADKLYQSSSLWAPANTPTFLHRDPFHTMVAQVVGHQYVRIYPADQMQYIYPHPDPFNRNTSLIRSPMLDRFHGDATATATTTSFAEEQSNLDLASRFPLLSQATYMECVLKPGELLYIPQGYWYFAKTLSYTFALSFQFAESKPSR